MLTWEEFVARYADLDVCRVFTGDEALGVGCDEACARMVSECGMDPTVCVETCGIEPRAIVDCWISSGTCEVQETCGSIHDELEPEL